jgi:serine protease Do
MENKKNQVTENILISLIIILVFFLGLTTELPELFSGPKIEIAEEIKVYTQEELVIKSVNNAFPSVVSIIATKDIPVIDRRIYYGPDGLEIDIKTEEKEVGSGTGFFVSSDGLVLTNRHVVSDLESDYTVITNNGEKLGVDVLARDPVYDLAILKVVDGGRFPFTKIGDSSLVKIGQTAIAIGNSLGEFSNTVSVGVVSGLGRSISATDGIIVETIEDVIQTDAAINKGNSGGPLLNLKGEVIGINTAMAVDAQSIGFSIPINKAKRMIESVIENGELIYPFLGIRYLAVNETVKEENDLSVNYGALIVKDEKRSIDPGSAAEEAGLKAGDILLEFNGVKIDEKNRLGSLILNYYPGDKVNLKILREEEELFIDVILGQKKW